MTRSLILILSSFMFFLLPWYYTESGSPQPVDIAIALLFLVLFLSRLPNLKFLTQYSSLFRTFLVFSSYSIITMLFVYILDTKDVTITLLILNFYYVILVTTFLLMIFYLHQMYTQQKFYRLVLVFLMLDLIIPFCFMAKGGAAIQRVSLSFNNPNQLGFFALVNFAFFMYITLWAKEQKILVNKWMSLIVINVNLLFIFLSASRACIPVILLYVCSYFLLFRIKVKGYSLWLVGLVGVAIGFVGIFSIGHKLYLHMVTTRLSMLPSDYSGLSNDIYFRAVRGINENFESIGYFLFGTGTYGTGTRGTLEFHNNFVALFHQVGLIGLLLYVSMNLIILRELFKKGIFYLLPYTCYLFYSMFQYSYRTRVNWLLLAVVIFVLMHDKISKLYLKNNKLIKGFQ